VRIWLRPKPKLVPGNYDGRCPPDLSMTFEAERVTYQSFWTGHDGQARARIGGP